MADGSPNGKRFKVIVGVPGTEKEKTMAKAQHLLPAIHPGGILRAEFMEPLHLSMNRLALDLRVPVTRIAEIVHERRGITPDTALRLARYFNTQRWILDESSDRL
jgi:antitoxin HigA-1